ncbi:unnamed protein product [Lactuca saligna]|uniref:CRA domain-containing protein n=1 Tax=Lactuca saligna TaxID=75948 RepID=A0AA35Z5K6_LACSI|nr:unnamed protein product [Lactuca saligna]
MAVKKAVQSGNIEDAIEKVNDLNLEIEETPEFAQEELAPRVEENQSFLKELERTLALLAFEDVKNRPVGDLLDISQHLKTASEVNDAILTSQSHEKDPKLTSLLRMLLWSQNQLNEKAAYPRITDQPHLKTPLNGGSSWIVNDSNASIDQFETIFFKICPAIKLDGFTSRQLRLIKSVVEKSFKDLAYIRGKVIAGRSVVDESMLTRESLPIFKEEGLFVSTGTINWDGPLKTEASSTGSNSTITKIVKMLLRLKLNAR